MNCTPDIRREPSLAQVLTNAIAALGLKIHTSCPAQVTAYRAVQGTNPVVDVQPQVKHPRLQDDGTIIMEQVPPLTDIPVEFPGAGGFRLTFPINPGDTGILEFQECPIDVWLQNGGVVDPQSLLRFEWAHAIFRPGLKPNNAAWTGVGARGANIGADGGPQIVMTSAGIELGSSDSSPAVQQAILGTEYTSAEATALGSVQLYLAGLATTGWADIAAAFTTLSITPPIGSPGSPNATMVTAAGACTAAAALAVTADADLTTFIGELASFLSQIVTLK